MDGIAEVRNSLKKDRDELFLAQGKLRAMIADAGKWGASMCSSVEEAEKTEELVRDQAKTMHEAVMADEDSRVVVTFMAALAIAERCSRDMIYTANDAIQELAPKT